LEKFQLARASLNVVPLEGENMPKKVVGLLLGMSLLAAAPASAQVVSGVMTVTGAEMH
jgi:hypothetical protein